MRHLSDWLGMGAAIGCAIHCAAMPFVIAYLPSLGLSFLADEQFHQWMAIGCFGIALSAFVPGFRRHGRLLPAIIGGGGLAMISIAAFGFAGDCCVPGESDSHRATMTEVSTCTDAHCQHCPVESSTESAGGPSDLSANVSPILGVVPSVPGFLLPWLTPLGGLVLVLAHLLNRHQCRCCGCDFAESGSSVSKAAASAGSERLSGA